MYLISDFINQIKVNSLNKKSFFDVNYSKLILDVCVILLNDGFIKNFFFISEINKIRVFINYYDDKSLMVQSSIFSTPGFRRYLTVKEIIRKFKFSNYAIISTPNGLISSHYLLNFFYKNFNLFRYNNKVKKKVLVIDNFGIYQTYNKGLIYSFKISDFKKSLLIN